MSIRERVYDEIEQLITENTREGVIGNYKEYSQIVEESSIGRHSVVHNGFRYSYNKETGDITAENICYATLTIKAVRNKPEVHLEFTDKVSSVRVGERIFSRSSNGDLKLKTTAAALESELSDLYVTIGGKEEKIAAENVVYSNESIESYYSYYDGRNTKRFVNLTPNNVSTWWEYDCPTLKKRVINKYGNCNDFGIRLMLWEDTLVEMGWSQAYLDEDISDYEIRTLTHGYEQTAYGHMILQEYRLQHTHYSDDEKAEIVRNIGEKVEAFKQLINEKADIIADIVYKNMCGPSEITSAEEKRKWIISNEGRYGLDCGFCYYSFADKNLKVKTRLAAEFGLESVHKSGEMFLKTSIGSHIQSTTVQAMEANAIIQLAKENGLPEMRYRTVLD